MTKPTYDTHVLPFLDKIEEWAGAGLSDAQIAKNLGIGCSTYYRYKNANPAFAQALRSSKEAADREVENALYKNAVGYTYTEEAPAKVKTVTYHPDTGKKLSETEEVVAAPTVKYRQPETAAAKFWLQCRQRERWGDRIEDTRDREIKVVLEGLPADYAQ